MKTTFAYRLCALRRSLWALLLGLVMTGCADAEFEPNFSDYEVVPDSEGYFTAFGVVDSDSAGRVFVNTDPGEKLEVARGSQHYYMLKEESYQGARIFFNYSIVASEDEYVNIYINTLYPLVVKDVGVADEALPTGAPATPVQASFGNGYININFYYPSLTTVYNYSSAIELYHDEEASTESNMVFRVVYTPTKNGDLTSANTYNQWHSFRLSEEQLGAACTVKTFTILYQWWKEEGNLSNGTTEYMGTMSATQEGDMVRSLVLE